MLQVIAIISMFLDHLGVLFNISVLRCVGRLAMPIYAYLLSVSVNKTSNLDKYTIRLAFLGFLTQIPYYIFIGESRCNIVFVWFICALLVFTHKECKKRSMQILIYFFCICFLLGGMKFDYGFIGVLWFFLFYILFQKDNLKAFYILGFIVFLYIVFQSYIELFALLSVPVIYISRKYNFDRLKNPKFNIIYRWFYPAHFIFLDIFKMLLGSTA